MPSSGCCVLKRISSCLINFRSMICFRMMIVLKQISCLMNSCKFYIWLVSVNLP